MDWQEEVKQFFHFKIIPCIVNGPFNLYALDDEDLIASAKFSLKMSVLGTCFDILKKQVQS